MAEGGTITPVSPQPTNMPDIIDYERMRSIFVSAAREINVITELIPLANGLNNIIKTKQSAGIFK